jgi:SAM-dependent methyltransferase
MKSLGHANACEICRATDWREAYCGAIRDGAFGNLSTGAPRVLQCNTCGAQRLEESACKDESFYEGTHYRELLAEASDAQGFWKAHDVHQMRNLQMFWPNSLRGKLVADIGCAAGSFLDHLGRLPRACLAVEPCREYHDSLRQRGYLVYASVLAAADAHRACVEAAFSFSTIEHVLNPLEYLVEIRQLMAPSGLLLISTPNRNDILMALLRDEYRRFFYRSVHRWYFDMKSLSSLVERAGFEIVNRRCLHRFGISNALHWLRDRRPSAETPMDVLNDPVLNEFWKSFLESKEVGDYLYLLARCKG